MKADSTARQSDGATTVVNWKGRATEALVGGIAGLAVVAIYIVARSTVSNIEAKDWLAFAGVIIGVILTIGATKLVDWVLNDAAERRRQRDFTLAVRSVAMGLADMAAAEPARLPDLGRATYSLWRVAMPLFDALQDLDFEHRTAIGLAQMTLEDCMPGLASNASLVATNPGLAPDVRAGAANLCRNVLPVTELFPVPRS